MGSFIVAMGSFIVAMGFFRCSYGLFHCSHGVAMGFFHCSYRLFHCSYPFHCSYGLFSLHDWIFLSLAKPTMVSFILEKLMHLSPGWEMRYLCVDSCAGQRAVNYIA